MGKSRRINPLNTYTANRCMGKNNSFGQNNGQENTNPAKATDNIKVVKILIIQPRVMANGVLPYPFFVDEKGMVGRQDFWKGSPLKILGFSVNPEPGTMELLFEDFWKDPQKAVGMYIVSMNASKKWSTHLNPVERVGVEHKG